MNDICSLCGKAAGNLHSSSVRIITNNVCSICIGKLVQEKSVPLRDFLNRYDRPLLAIDPDGRVEAANRTAVRMLGKSIETVTGKLGGDAINCVNSKLPGGCGKTKGCVTCNIRNTVMETHASGIGKSSVESLQEIATPFGVKTMKFVFSTEKLNGIVLFGIEDSSPVEQG